MRSLTARVPLGLWPNHSDPLLVKGPDSLTLHRSAYAIAPISPWPRQILPQIFFFCLFDFFCILHHCLLLRQKGILLLKARKYIIDDMSGSRGPPQSSSRHNEHDDYGAYKPLRLKRAPFQGPRRDYTKAMPGSSSLTHSMGSDRGHSPAAGSASGSLTPSGASNGRGEGAGSALGGSRRFSSASRSHSAAYGLYGAGGDRYVGYSKPWRSSSDSLSAQGPKPGGSRSLSNGSSARYDLYAGTAAAGRNSIAHSNGSFGKRLSSGDGAGTTSATFNRDAAGDSHYPPRTVSTDGDRYSSRYRGAFKGRNKRFGGDELHDNRRDYYAHQQTHRRLQLPPLRPQAEETRVHTKDYETPRRDRLDDEEPNQRDKEDKHPAGPDKREHVASAFNQAASDDMVKSEDRAESTSLNDDMEVDHDGDDDEVPPAPNDNQLEVAPVDVSQEVMYKEGCKFPMTYMDAEFSKLQQEFASKTKRQDMEQLDFRKLPFYSENIDLYLHHKFDDLKASFETRNRSLQMKKLQLWSERERGWKEWMRKCAKMEDQLKVLHPADDEMKRELSAIDVRPKLGEQATEGNGQNTPHGPEYNANSNISNGNANFGLQSSPSGTGRRNRRHGDLVTTEAEFQEVLRSLEREQDEDPVAKAQRVAANVPDFILDPVKRERVKFYDSNNIVKDKVKWSQRVHADFQDTFSYEEHELFCEGFCITPKRFGSISRYVGGLRTPEECVLHYYLTKKAVNYKLMVNQFKKKASKKNSSSRRKSAKSKSSLSGAPLTPITDNVAGDDIEAIAAKVAAEVTSATAKPAFDELYTDTGRRKRAAAPVFKEGNDSEPVRKKSKKKKEDDGDVKFSATNEPAPAVAELTISTAQSLDEGVEVASVDTAAPAANPTEASADSPPPVTVSAEPAPNDSAVSDPASSLDAMPATADAIAAGVSPGKSSLAGATAQPVVINDGHQFAMSLSSTDALDTEPYAALEAHTDGDRKRTITSYWSITEANLFPELLAEHGTKWTTIADKLATKTATMVRNYFQRNCDKQGWLELVRVADARLEAKYAAVLGDGPHLSLPLGTFQHSHHENLPTQLVVPHRKASIELLLQGTDSPGAGKLQPPLAATTVSADPPVHDPPQRSSIMSLLNSDSSPVKPPAPAIPSHSSLQSLLNSPPHRH